MTKSDWAERKAWAMYERFGINRLGVQLVPVADMAAALRAERSRAVRVCRKLASQSVVGYSVGCSACAAAIIGKP